MTKRKDDGNYSINGYRFCSNCMSNKTSIGGSYKIFSNGKQRRWRCAGCTISVELRGLVDINSFCSSCRMIKNTIGGSYKIINGGKARRWRCIDCTERVKLRDECRI
jgi:hypothetical protein